MCSWRERCERRQHAKWTTSEDHYLGTLLRCHSQLYEITLSPSIQALASVVQSLSTMGLAADRRWSGSCQQAGEGDRVASHSVEWKFSRDDSRPLFRDLELALLRPWLPSHCRSPHDWWHSI